MKKMVKVVALLAAMVVSVALTGCNGKKGQATSSKTEASAKSGSVTSGRKRIDAFFKDYEKIVNKAESAAKKGNSSSLTLLQTEVNKLVERLDEFQNASDWNDRDTEMFFELGLRYAAAEYKLSN